MHYDLIYSRLKSLSAQTALLEAADWDEDKLNRVMLEVDDYFRFLNPEYFNSWGELEADVANHLTQKFDKKISDIIINILNLEKESFLKSKEKFEQ